MDNKKIKFGVIGVGYLGKYHVKHLTEFDFIDLKNGTSFFLLKSILK